MKKILVLCLIIFLLAIAFNAPITFNLPSIDITGLFLKASSTIVTIARSVIKQVLTIIIGVL